MFIGTQKATRIFQKTLDFFKLLAYNGIRSWSLLFNLYQVEMWRRVSLEILPLAALGWGEDLFFIRSGSALGRFFFILGNLRQLFNTLDGLALPLVI